MATTGSNTATVRERSSTASPEPQAASAVIGGLFAALDAAGVRYCHWKSNVNLAETLRGEGDIDVLIARSDAAKFHEVLGRLGYKPTISDQPSITHYYGLDADAGRLVHVHAYYRIVTGGTVLKNHHLPIEEMLLDGDTRIDSVRVPRRAAELVSFVVRKCLEYAQPIEALFVVRDAQAVVRELAWLGDGVTESDVASLLRVHLAAVDAQLFADCRAALASGSLAARRRAGRRLAVRLSQHRRYGALRAGMMRVRRLVPRVARRLRGGKSQRALLAGGAVVAVVGPDGAGKSTIVAELERLFASDLAARAVHAGRPPASPLTFLPRLLVPAMRRLLPRYRKSRIEVSSAAKRPSGGRRLPRLFSFLIPLRALMIAHERRRLLLCAHRVAAGGTIVVTDRYPTPQRGVPDGPVLWSLLGTGNRFYAWLARQEERSYRRMPPPDAVLRLDVPVDLACHRNLTRDKRGGPKSSGYVRLRHAQVSALEFPGVPVHRVDASGDLAQTLRSTIQLVWKTL